MWHMPLVPALGRQRKVKESFEFEANLGTISKNPKTEHNCVAIRLDTRIIISDKVCEKF